MFIKSDIAAARQFFEDGKLPADILRYFSIQHPDASVPDLMQLMHDAFFLSYDAVRCIGVWWHDGSGELNDDHINAFLIPAIEKASTHVEGSD